VLTLALSLQLAASVATAAPTQARDSVPVLYQRVDYGTQALFSPLTVILNKGFDHLQADNSQRNIWILPIGRSLAGAPLDALQHPVRAIEHYPGWRRWFATEIFPVNFTVKDARWAVNYSEHMVAGGLTYRELAQWYDAHGFPMPRLWSGVTTFGASMLNEAMEFVGTDTAASSTVADLYVFDLGGILLFNWDPLVRFFAGTLQASDWSTQASFTFPNHELQNNGQYYITKLPLPKTDARLFFRFGMGVQSGLSVPVRGANSLTLALGVDTDARVVDPATRDESITTSFSGGVYWDRNNSLLLSLTAGPTENQVVLNVFPGVLPGVARSVGTWVVLTRDRQLLWGLTSGHLLGAGIGYGR
jgi:hypothetical protein